MCLSHNQQHYSHYNVYISTQVPKGNRERSREFSTHFVLPLPANPPRDTIKLTTTQNVCLYSSSHNIHSSHLTPHKTYTVLNYSGCQRPPTTNTYTIFHKDLMPDSDSLQYQLAGLQAEGGQGGCKNHPSVTQAVPRQRGGFYNPPDPAQRISLLVETTVSEILAPCLLKGDYRPCYTCVELVMLLCKGVFKHVCMFMTIILTSEGQKSDKKTFSFYYCDM